MTPYRTFWQYLSKGQPAWIWVILFLVALLTYTIIDRAWLAVGILSTSLAVIFVNGYFDWRKNG